MKNKIIFAGAMAAILGATNASAAVQVASKNYVDTQVGNVDAKVGNATFTSGDYVNEDTDATSAILSLDAAISTVDGTVTTMGDTVTSMQSTVTNLGDTVNNVQQSVTNITNMLGDNLDGTTLDELLADKADKSDLADKADKSVVDGLQTTVGELESGVSQLQTDISGKQDKMIGASYNGDILTVGEDGNISHSATIAEGKVAGLTAKLKGMQDAIDMLSGTEGGQGLASISSDLAALKEKVGAVDLNSAAGANLTAAVNSLYEKIAAAMGSNGALNADGTLADGAVDMDALSQELQEAINKIKDMTFGALASKNTVGTNEIDNGAVTADKLGADLANLKKMAAASCGADSGLCVLSYGTDGNFQWVDVTNPAE